MKPIASYIYFLAIVFFLSCDDPGERGSLVVKGVATIAKSQVIQTERLRVSAEATVNVMHTADIKFDVAELWVSQELVREGVKDDFKWYKIGVSQGLKNVKDYFFESDELPEGNYQSMKMVFRNGVSRMAVFKSNLSQQIEMLSSLSEESCPDESLVINYFSSGGNFSLQDNVFKLASKGENIRGFKVKAGETTTIQWMLGSPSMQMTDCSFEWVDVNQNGKWDCGVDQTRNHECSVKAPMFSFSVDDGEPDPDPEPDSDYIIIFNALSDKDRNMYPAVKIGDQIWMAQNLRTRYLSDSTFITNQLGADAWNNAGFVQKSPAQTVYSGNVDLILAHGRLYNGYAVQTGKLCPEGWHVPTLEEWKKLFNHFGTKAGGKLKEAGTSHWQQPNEGATNESKFYALPSGRRFMNAEFTDLGTKGWFWTSTIYGEGMMEVIMLDYQTDYPTHSVQLTRFDPVFGASCRCVKD